MNRHAEKRLADEVLSVFQTLDPKAVVAGGAPRDWWMGKECADIDIYLSLPELDDDHLRITLLEKLGFKCISQLSTTDEDYEGLSDLLAVFEFNFEGKKFNVMFMEDCDGNYTQHFDCSICEITYDGKQYHPSPAFMKTLLDKVIYVNAPADETTPHVEKMASKFPDFKFAKYLTVSARSRVEVGIPDEGFGFF